MDDLFLKVKCPNDGENCLIDGGGIEEKMVLLGDDEQNMQCLTCGYASNKNMKSHINDNPFPDDFKAICKNFNDRWWAPSVFQTEHYMVIPLVEDDKLKWRLFARSDPSTEVVVPHFSDAFKMVEKLEKTIGDQI
jgi:hypothetical protein|tara:strand:- start:102 stop:506 length:405 start_codon:yes stop_codon:yes gene_type:complete